MEKKIQKRSRKYTKGPFGLSIEIDSSYESLLIKSQLPSLKVRRLRAIALEAFKILNNLSPVYLNDLLTFKSHTYSFRYTKTVEIHQVRTNRLGTRSFRSTVAKMWNNLPQHFRDITNNNVFKNQVHSWSERPVCVCSFCSDV